MSNQAVKYRTARRVHRCEGCRRRAILTGHRYEIHTLFPGHDIVTTDRPLALKRCISCSCERDDSAHLAANACGRFCHGTTPCARPFNHDGDCSCREDALEAASRDLAGSVTRG